MTCRHKTMCFAVMARTAAITLAFVLALSFAGCGRADGAQSGSGAQAAASAPATEADTQASAASPTLGELFALPDFYGANTGSAYYELAYRQPYDAAALVLKTDYAAKHKRPFAVWQAAPTTAHNARLMWRRGAVLLCARWEMRCMCSTAAVRRCCPQTSSLRQNKSISMK